VRANDDQESPIAVLIREVASPAIDDLVVYYQLAKRAKICRFRRDFDRRRVQQWRLGVMFTFCGPASRAGYSGTNVWLPQGAEYSQRHVGDGRRSAYDNLAMRTREKSGFVLMQIWAAAPC
jgi:hypothetical protein